MDIQDLPDEYWVVNTDSSTIRVSGETATNIGKAMNAGLRMYQFLDMFGASAIVNPSQITDLYYTSPELRRLEREWEKKLLDEIGFV